MKSITKESLIKFEKDLEKLWSTGSITAPVHFSGGNEDILIEYFKKVHASDWVISTWRNHYHYLLKTGNTKFLLDKILKEHNSMHIIDLDNRFISTAIVGGNVSIATGIAYAIKLKKSRSRVHCFVGDGGCDQGWFFEGLRYSIGQDLPITFVVEDNDRSVETTILQRWGGKDMFMQELQECPKVFYYRYIPTYPHVGSGKPINW